MAMKIAAALCVASLAVLANFAEAVPATKGDQRGQETDHRDLYKLPDGFLFGVGISSYQTEGAWDEDGKGVNVYDVKYHKTEAENGDVAADFYHRFREDIGLAAEMKVNAFRFSISWARIFPNGRRSSLEPRGVQFYHDVIDELLRNNIQPIVTLSHFDHPQALEDELGGWRNGTIVNIFAEYADFLFNEYGDKVKYWTTLNEINLHCRILPGVVPPDFNMGGDDNKLVPGAEGNAFSKSSAYYTCIRNELLAHSAAYRLYKTKYAEKQKGLVGIGAVSFFSRPNSSEYDDIAAAHRANMFDLGAVLHPLVHGDFPPVMRSAMDAPGSKVILPTFTEEESKRMRGSIDFVGLNAYDGFYIVDSANTNGEPTPESAASTLLGAADANATFVAHKDPVGSTLIGATIGGRQLTPWILADCALWITANYGKKIAIMVTENGISGEKSLNDYDMKATYISAYLGKLIKVTNKYQLNVIGYTYWSFIDLFEWMGQYGTYGGIVKVDYEGKSLKRTKRKSWEYFEEIGRTRRVRQLQLQSRKGPGSGSDKHLAPTALLILILAACSLSSAVLNL